jgi:hypothetical protein
VFSVLSFVGNVATAIEADCVENIPPELRPVLPPPKLLGQRGTQTLTNITECTKRVYMKLKTMHAVTLVIGTWQEKINIQMLISLTTRSKGTIFSGTMKHADKICKPHKV